jgi:hypothetical protein
VEQVISIPRIYFKLLNHDSSIDIMLVNKDVSAKLILILQDNKIFIKLATPCSWILV